LVVNDKANEFAEGNTIPDHTINWLEHNKLYIICGQQLIRRVPQPKAAPPICLKIS
jgi:hypothetical protein